MSKGWGKEKDRMVHTNEERRGDGKTSSQKSNLFHFEALYVVASNKDEGSGQKTWGMMRGKRKKKQRVG